MAKVLGITGGIGAGKSHVCKVFVSLGCPVYDSDSHTKRLYDENEELLSGLAALLGEGILENVAGRKVLNKQAMASVIFRDRVLMEKVKDFVYPFVMEDFCKWKRWKRGVVIFESAVILENPYVRSFMDKVLVITAPMEERIKRVVRRDRISLEQVEARLANQCSDEQRIAEADFVIESVDGNDVEFQARRIIESMNRE